MIEIKDTFLMLLKEILYIKNEIWICKNIPLRLTYIHKESQRQYLTKKFEI